MRVTVEFFGPAREAAGAARLGVECDMPCTAERVWNAIEAART